MSQEREKKIESLKLIGAALGIFAGIVSSLATIGDKGLSALETALVIAQYSGMMVLGYVYFASWFMAFFVLESKILALLVSVVCFFGGFYIFQFLDPVSVDYTTFSPDSLSGKVTPLGAVVFTLVGVSTWAYGINLLIKKYGSE